MIICADARRIPLANESVQCVVTSPPYWGLRKYAGEQELIWGPTQCEHEWQGHTLPDPEIRTGLGLAAWSAKHARGGGHKAGAIHSGQVPDNKNPNSTVDIAQNSTGSFCSKCGAWRGSFGLEPTVEMYVEHSILILREIGRVLGKDGVCFWNIGDCYATGAGKVGDCPGGGERGETWKNGPKRYRDDSKGRGTPQRADGQGGHVYYGPMTQPNRMPQEGLKAKDLVLMPARIALAAQADGWWVRSDIIWAKPNPMPESVKDRPTDAYEHILMLTKSERYFWDAAAVAEPANGWNGSSFTDERDMAIRPNTGTRPRTNGKWSTEAPESSGRRIVESVKAARDAGARHDSPFGETRNMRNVWGEFGYTPKGTHSKGNGNGGPKAEAREQEGKHEGWTASTRKVLETRNMRNLWMFATQPYKGAHFATFPEELPRRCIKAASRPGDLILDPFAGSGTTGRVAIELQRKPILLDLAYAHDYAPLARERTTNVQLEAFV